MGMYWLVLDRGGGWGIYKKKLPVFEQDLDLNLVLIAERGGAFGQGDKGLLPSGRAARPVTGCSIAWWWGCYYSLNSKCGWRRKCCGHWAPCWRSCCGRSTAAWRYQANVLALLLQITVGSAAPTDATALQHVLPPHLSLFCGGWRWCWWYDSTQTYTIHISTDTKVHSEYKISKHNIYMVLIDPQT